MVTDVVEDTDDTLPTITEILPALVPISAPIATVSPPSISSATSPVVVDNYMTPTVTTSTISGRRYSLSTTNHSGASTNSPAGLVNQK